MRRGYLWPLPNVSWVGHFNLKHRHQLLHRQHSDAADVLHVYQKMDDHFKGWRSGQRVFRLAELASEKVDPLNASCAINWQWHTPTHRRASHQEPQNYVHWIGIWAISFIN